MTPQQIEDFLKAAEAKYDKGQAEHGGLITDRDLKDEQLKELIDLGHYHAASVFPNRFNTDDPEYIRGYNLGLMRHIFMAKKKRYLTEWERAWRTLVELTLNDK